MRAVSLHPGVQPGDVAPTPPFEVYGLDDAGSSRLPTGDELDLIARIDPRALRDKEVKI